MKKTTKKKKSTKFKSRAQNQRASARSGFNLLLLAHLCEQQQHPQLASGQQERCKFGHFSTLDHDFAKLANPMAGEKMKNLLNENHHHQQQQQ